ncbi:MAG: T9SS type A sorting domain-containing protein [Crocinitomicaceae bacterium]|jgi:hypothetical protein|nr:T9SS type A sorting domain-containing protein [Crocinitomicaceae bacterium]MBT6029873.1 T9SS type A sorting domain-containing protein [Crocinitomicaceae bacterium]MBT6513335.1 T9SS type A sorting domain-containing protein [Crocinitomicaceae bacterium]
MTDLLFSKARRIVFLLSCSILFSSQTIAQDTVVFQTLTWDSSGRNYVFDFPDVPGETYEKILMLYNMRCKNAVVSSGGAPNAGCGEWDYSCNTYVTDSSRTDSLMATAPNYVISGFSGSTYDYSINPTFTYYQSNQIGTQYSDTTAEVFGILGTGAVTSSYPFDMSTGLARTQYLFSAAELAGSGLAAGDLTGLKLDLSSLGSAVNNLRIGLKASNRTNLHPDTLELDDFTNVYYLNTSFSSVGQHQFNFHSPFSWDGVSNIIVELSHDQSSGSSSVVTADNYGSSGVGIANTGLDHCLEFNGGQLVHIGAPMPTVTNEITISFWCFGDTTVMPANSTIVEGRDASNNRQLNVHLPWSNSRIYWDCGNDGTGYDRIDNAANAADFKGKWNHFAFTKNTSTGIMRIYLNGVQWLSGSGKTKAIDLQELNIGGSITSSNLKYFGKIDEFRIWDKELSGVEIASWMHKSVDGTHPSYSNLVTYHKFDDGAGSSTTDEIGLANGSFVSTPYWRLKGGKDLFMNFTLLNDRPQMDLIQGIYTSVFDTTAVLDSLENMPNQVDEYAVVGTDLSFLSTNYYWLAGPMSIFDESGVQIGTLMAPIDNSLTITDLNYFNKYPMKFEIMSLVTPYGIGLDLGSEGKTFTFDVTDFTPILRGLKRMSIERGGQNQEELDIKFLYIKGTPARDVIDINQIWPVRSNGYASIMADNVYEPRMVPTNASATDFEIRTVITGHGQEGEFIPRNHFINAAGGPNELFWEVWKECAENPIIDQGGTWIYDRAGWCPGMASDMQRTAISPLVTPGTPIEIDYGVTTASGTSNYIVNNQLVSYGAPNFLLDASVIDVIRPSQKIEHEKYNPICSQPIVVLQNRGSATLTSVNISYNLQGSVAQTYSWTGSLDFLETEEVMLPTSAPDFWDTSGVQTVFEVSVSNPNLFMDENPDNDTYLSEIETYPIYSGALVLQYRMNTYAHENYFEIYDETGNVVFSRTGLAPGTYSDSIFLSAGCYKIRYLDTVSTTTPNSGNDGISWWANPDQGVGYFRIRVNGVIKLIANPDFGGFFEHSFYISYANSAEDEKQTQTLAVYPNPASDKLKVNFYGFNEDMVRIEVINETGKLVLTESFANDKFNLNRKELAIGKLESGIYFARIIDKEMVKVSKFIKY